MTAPAVPQEPLTLAGIADTDGTMTIIAMDQRNTLRRMFASHGIDPSDDDMRAAKVDVARALSGGATGILFDPEYGVPAVRAAGALAPTCGLLVAAEPTDRGDYNGEPRPYRRADQDAAWVRAMGGDAVKFLVMMNPLRPIGPGEPDLTAETVEVVREIVKDCRAVGIPSVIENLIYSVPGADPMTEDERAEVIIRSAELLSATQPDLLKLEYPGSPEACRRLAGTITVPWAVLSAGVDFDRFTDVVAISCDEGGASGCIAGRSVWKEAIGMAGAERATFLDEVARPRLDAIRTVVSAKARPWFAA